MTRVGLHTITQLAFLHNILTILFAILDREVQVSDACHMRKSVQKVYIKCVQQLAMCIQV